MRHPRNLVAATLCCATALWLLGPPGRLLVALPLLLFGPGYLAGRALGPIAPAAPLVRLALWLGLSLSLVALLYEWITVFGLALSAPLLTALVIACGLGILWSIWRDGQPETRRQGDRETRDTRHETRDTRHEIRDTRHETRDTRYETRDTRHETTLQSPVSSLQSPVSGLRSPVSWSGAMLLAIFALTLLTRAVEIRDLALPAWVDSIHHALMIRVAAERGQAPISLRPYLPVDQLPYHWGYHVFVATAMRLAGLPLGQAMLWIGQALNALHVLTVAALAAYLWRRPAAGVVAGLIVGLLSIFPAYYVSWGRYTQLTGLLLLPPLAIAWLALLGAPAWPRSISVALLLAGLSLIHFIVLAFALCFMVSSAAVWAARAGWAESWRRLGYVLGSGALALALAAPWIASLAARALLPAVAQPASVIAGGPYSAIEPSLLWAGHNRWLIALALLAALWGLRRRSPVAAQQVAWVGLLFVMVNPWLATSISPAAGAALALAGALRRRLVLGLAGLLLLLLNPAFVQLPYIGLLTNESVVISLFIPIGVLLGGGGCLLWEQIACVPWSLVLGPWGRRRGTKDKGQGTIEVARIAGGVVVAALALWGAWGLRDVVNPVTVLATPADVAAIAWVAENTPADARFLINAAPWLDTADRGADGGWWLLPLAGRWTSTPPVLSVYGPPDYVRDVRARNAVVIGYAKGQEQRLYQMLDRERIDYVYLGPRPAPLTPATFLASARFAKVYERDGVTIFAVRR